MTDKRTIKAILILDKMRRNKRYFTHSAVSCMWVPSLKKCKAKWAKDKLLLDLIEEYNWWALWDFDTEKYLKQFEEHDEENSK